MQSSHDWTKIGSTHDRDCGIGCGHDAHESVLFARPGGQDRERHQIPDLMTFTWTEPYDVGHYLGERRRSGDHTPLPPFLDSVLTFMRYCTTSNCSCPTAAKIGSVMYSSVLYSTCTAPSPSRPTQAGGKLTFVQLRITCRIVTAIKHQAPG